jgi:hypothetical protein
MRVLLELVGVDEAEKLGVSAFSLALDRLEVIDAKHSEIAPLQSVPAWDDERRNKFFSLVESYAHKHRQFYYPENGIDDDVREDIQNLWGIRAQIAEMLGIPPLPKDEAES